MMDDESSKSNQELLNGNIVEAQGEDEKEDDSLVDDWVAAESEDAAVSGTPNHVAAPTPTRPTERRSRVHFPSGSVVATVISNHSHISSNNSSSELRAKYPLRECTFRLPRGKHPIVLNPVVTSIGVVCLWGLVIWSSVDPSGALKTLAYWRTHVTLTCSWIFQAAKAIFFFFLLFIAYKYGHLHLGPTSDVTPEFSSLAYFSMIFAAGSTVGLLVYSVAEPLDKRSGHFYSNGGYRSQDEIDMFAINMTLTDWGISGWTPFAVTAVAMSLAAHRFGLPMTFRSCFYPILGAYTWGWMGDLIDGVTIVVTVVGVFTSLGLGAIQLVSGFTFLGIVDRNSSDAQLTAIQNSTVWVITVVSTAAVVCGLYGGTPVLSGVALTLSTLLMFLVFIMDDTKFLLNLQVQEVGYYLQNSIFQLNFWTDAFSQLREGSGRAADGKAGDVDWVDRWLIFSAGWWFATSAGFGIFVACLSRGRKLWEVIVYCLAAPVGYCLVWFCIWGGIGLRQSRQALELQVLGERYFNSSDHFMADGSDLCYSVPQEDVLVDGTVVFKNHLIGVTPVCLYDPTKFETAVYNVLYSFGFSEKSAGDGLGPFYVYVFVLTSVVYFAIGSEYSSLALDCLSANGYANKNLITRMFWLVTVGAVATALLSSGGEEALNAIKAAIIVCGLPFAIVLCYVIQCILMFCQAAEKNVDEVQYRFPDQPQFKMPVYGGVFNLMEYSLSLGKVHAARVQLEMHKATGAQITEFAKGLFFPFVSMYQILSAAYPQNVQSNIATVICYTILYTGWISVYFASFSHPGLSAWCIVLFFAAGGTVAVLRSGFRTRYNIRSNPVADLVTGLFMWPQVFAQMRLQCLDVSPENQSPQ